MRKYQAHAPGKTLAAQSAAYAAGEPKVPKLRVCVQKQYGRIKGVEGEEGRRQKGEKTDAVIGASERR